MSDAEDTVPELSSSSPSPAVRILEIGGWLMLGPLWLITISWSSLVAWGGHTGRWDVMVYGLIFAMPLRYLVFPGLLFATTALGVGLLFARRWGTSAVMLASAAYTGWWVWSVP